MEQEALWRAYQKSKDPQAKEKLILQYLPLVRFLAGRLGGGLPAHFDREDLVSYGILGLLEAIDRYDQQRGVKFETYARARIRGAMLDNLRRAYPFPRSLEEKLRKLMNVSERLEQVYGPGVTEEKLAAELKISVEELQSLWAYLHYFATVSLEEFLAPGGKEKAGTLPDQKSPDPSAVYEEKELQAHLEAALGELLPKDQLVLALYYQEELTLKEIGAVLGVSESRACQLRTRALLRLRAKLKERGY